MSAEPVTTPRCAVLDEEHAPGWVTEAITGAGGEIAPIERADALLLWHHPRSVSEVREALECNPGIRWVQLPSAGVDRYAELFGRDDGRLWTCAKAVYSEPVAEHALALLLAGLRQFVVRARTNRWGDETDLTLFDAPVTLVGGGGVTQCLLRLLAPFRVRATVVRRNVRPMDGAVRVLPSDRLPEALPGAMAVVLNAALTAETEGLIGERELRAMGPDAWLVNIARGKLVVTDDLVRALREGWIGGAGLDATDPEPLPPDHPLWTLDNCLITPHVACGYALGLPLLADRFRDNVKLFAAGEPMVGAVDLERGY